MSDLVLIPVHTRADYLWLTLEALANADGAQDKDVIVGADTRGNGVDAGIHAAVGNVVNRFASIKVVLTPNNKYAGNGYNFLTLYQRALATQARYVYLVEDDVIVGKDFFKWHEAVQESKSYWCGVAWHCERNKEVARTIDGNAIVESTRDYSSIGVCWRRENLVDVVEHCNEDYFRDPVKYCYDNFDWKEGTNRAWCEQAGLIMHILMTDKNKVVAWSGVRRVAHVGAVGYHRPMKQQHGELVERVERLRKQIASGELANNDDIDTLAELTEWSADKLFVAQRV